MELERRSFLKGLAALIVTSPLKAPVLRFEESYLKTVVVDFSYSSNSHLIRSAIWSKQIKEILLNELQAMKFDKIID